MDILQKYPICYTFPMNISTTQTTNYVAFAGVIVMILAHFHINIGSDEITAVLGAIVTLFGILLNWCHRYQKGDLKASGIRKNI